MLLLELYRYILGFFDLSNITYGQDIALCGVAYLCLFLDGILATIFVMLMVRLITGKTIFYWINKIAGQKLV